MKILSLEFENLNSLKGSWKIDFQSQDFVDNGLFVITGHTGAGKSTLLDAICLALYQQTPRLDKLTQSKNELMTRGTGSCRAEVDFSVKDKRYRVSWEQKRARKQAEGKLQAPICELATFSGDILATKSSEVLKRVIELTGLDFSRFTKSMLLAQGGFAAFLNASPKDRAELLEELTGTEIYAQISQYIFERNKEIQSELIQLTNQSALLTRLDDEDLASLLTEIDNLQQDYDNKTKQIKSVEVALQWQALAVRLTGQLKVASETLQQAQQAFDDFAPQKEKIVGALKAQPIVPYFVALNEQKKLVENNVNDFNEQQQKLTQLQDRLNTAEQFATYLSAKHQKAVLHHQAQTQRLNDELIPMDSQISDVTEQLNESLPLLEVQRQDTQKSKRCLDALSQQLNSEQNKNVSLSEKLKQQQTVIIDNDNLTLLEQFLSRYENESQKLQALAEKSDQSTDKITQTNALLNQVKKRLNDDETRLKSNTEAIAQIDVQKKSLIEKIGDNGSERLSQLHQKNNALIQLQQMTQSLDRLMQDNSKIVLDISGKESLAEEQKQKLSDLERQGKRLAIEEQDLQTLIKQDTLLRSIQDLQLQLEENHPCPLCGALEHPAVQNHVNLDIDSTEIRLQKKSKELNKKRAEYDQLKGQLKGLVQQIAELHKRQLEQKNEIASLSSNWLTNSYAQSLQLSYLPSSAELLNEKSNALADEINELENALKEYQQLERSALPLLQQKEQSNSQIIELKEQLNNVLNDLKIYQSTQSELSVQSNALQTEQKQLVEKIATCLPQNVQLPLILACPEEWLQSQKMQIMKFNEITEQLAQSTQTLQQLTQQYALQSQQQEQNERQFAEKELQLQQITARKNSLQAMRIQQFTEQSRQQLQQGYDQQLQITQAELEKAHAELNRLKLEIESVQGVCIALTSAKRKISDTQQEVEKQFNEQLSNNDYKSINEFQENCLDHQQIASLQTNLTVLNDALLTQKTQFESIQKQYDDHQASCPTNLDETQLNGRLTEFKGQLLSLNESLMNKKMTLQIDQSNKKKQQQLQQQQTDFKDTAHNWELLNKLIGQADGSKFRKFAQGLTLDNLIYLANREMAHLDQRYQLQRNVDEELALQVIDCWQANSVRDVKTLSGGESFLVSLGLALALSNLVSHKTQIESLFLDEGFGTLDESTLSMALDALERLNSTGKLIGIISHVDALKERINHQIHVHKNSGAGYSVLDKQYRKGE
ncbi:chromosome segregation protein SMC [Psychromonas sp. psych-6C06]|uniref:AAA family ATPase n=1 Tax=Psychromonas sp. psych-6C06 TaxID=2058089 RepID=UPI000C33D575|nr:AAA family ATPase [Psychromonas sp. psych-6C06]PKF62199.1 chromosome segregation protein SMC [Psychromonas sp. psych-6C06]